MQIKVRVDWRWKQAVAVVDRNIANINRAVRDFDPVSQEVAKFKYDYDRGLGHRHPTYNAAASIYFTNNALRAMLEGSLLCGREAEELELVLGVPAHVIQSYHDMFFDVHDKLDNPGWISAVVFGGFAHDGASAASRREIGLRIAWIGGWDLFVHFISGGMSEKEEQRLIGDVLTSILGRRSIGMAFTAGNHPGSTEVIRTFADLAGIKETETSQQDGGVAEAGKKLLEEFKTRILGSDRRAPLVADIADARNLEAPAREKRESQYMAEATAND